MGLFPAFAYLLSYIDEPYRGSWNKTTLLEEAYRIVNKLFVQDFRIDITSRQSFYLFFSPEGWDVP